MNKEETIEKIQLALEEVRPFLNSDGGDISFIELKDDGTVMVELHGACTGCSVNQMTLKSGVEMTIKKYAPQVNRVLEVNQSMKA